MFKQTVSGTSEDRVNRASSACIACPDGLPLIMNSATTSMKINQSDFISHKFDQSRSKSAHALDIKESVTPNKLLVHFKPLLCSFLKVFFALSIAKH